MLFVSGLPSGLRTGVSIGVVSIACLGMVSRELGAVWYRSGVVSIACLGMVRRRVVSVLVSIACLGMMSRGVVSVLVSAACLGMVSRELVLVWFWELYRKRVQGQWPMSILCRGLPATGKTTCIHHLFTEIRVGGAGREQNSEETGCKTNGCKATGCKATGCKATGCKATKGYNQSEIQIAHSKVAI